MSDTDDLFYAIAHTIQRGILSDADRAELRRMDPRRLDATAFWKLAGLHLDSALPGERSAREDAETDWAAVAVAIAVLGDLQQRGTRLGRSLAEAGLSELRLTRLLRADRTQLRAELPWIARFLTAKQVRADLWTGAQLLLHPTSDTARRGLARDYYASLARAT